MPADNRDEFNTVQFVSPDGETEDTLVIKLDKASQSR
jgi:hypothetical protein